MSRARSPLGAAVAVVGLLTAAWPGVQPASAARPTRSAGRYLVRATTPGGQALLAGLTGRGRSVDVLAGLGAVAADLDGATASTLAADGRLQVAAVAARAVPGSATRSAPRPPARRPAAAVPRDPAARRPGLLWNLERIGALGTAGRADVTVAVLDTGIDATHRELAGRVAASLDVSDPTVCADVAGVSDADLAATYGGPAGGDWSGHGTWIAGTVAANVDGVGVQGVAPGVTLVAVKISEWCGYALDDAILRGIVAAADRGVDVINISFGGYLDRSDPDQDVLYRLYADAVAYARARGAVVVAAAGNEHVRLAADGTVTTHGQLSAPGEDLPDLYGFTAIPAGVPGVLAVSATNNVVAAPTSRCRVALGDLDAACKPLSDPHQPVGVGRTDQLAYMSNYGPRIDIAAPGGAVKFNVPIADGGGTLGFPWTRGDASTPYGVLGITSNWAVAVPCFFDVGVGYPGECYSTIQGTSMAAPHVSAVAALVASASPRLRHRPDAIAAVLRATATSTRNATPPLAPADTSPGDRTGVACPSGSCHLDGPAISDVEAYGAGLVHAGRAVARARRG